MKMQTRSNGHRPQMLDPHTQRNLWKSVGEECQVGLAITYVYCGHGVFVLREGLYFTNLGQSPDYPADI